MNWFISFNTHAFIKSNRYTEKLLRSESMQTGIVLYLVLFLSLSLSLSLFLSFSHSLFSFSLLRLHLFNNPPPHKSAEIRGERDPPRRLHCRWYSDREFPSFFFFFSGFCLINTRIEDKVAEKRTADIATTPTRAWRRDDENFPLDTAPPMRYFAVQGKIEC